MDLTTQDLTTERPNYSKKGGFGDFGTAAGRAAPGGGPTAKGTQLFLFPNLGLPPTITAEEIFHAWSKRRALQRQIASLVDEKRGVPTIAALSRQHGVNRKVLEKALRRLL